MRKALRRLSYWKKLLESQIVGFEPLGHHLRCGRNLVRADPKALCEVAFRNKAFSISFNAGNSAAGARDNQTDFLAGHCLSVVDKNVCMGAAILLHQSGVPMITVSYFEKSTFTGSMAG